MYPEEGGAVKSRGLTHICTPGIVSRMRIPLSIVPSVILAAVILTASLVPDVPLPESRIPGLDKIAHAAAYAALAAVLLFGLRKPGTAFVGAVLRTVVVCTLYGGAIELLQRLTGRTADPLDFLANAAGALLGAGLAAAAAGRFTRRTDRTR